MNASDRTFSLRLPDELAQRLAEDARRHERSVGGSVRALVRQALDHEHEHEHVTRHGFDRSDGGGEVR